MTPKELLDTILGYLGFVAEIDEQRSEVASYVYWIVGLPALFAGIAAWYRWRARRVGMRVDWRPFVVTGTGVLVLLAIMVAVPGGDRADEPPWYLGLTILIGLIYSWIAGADRNRFTAWSRSLGRLAWASMFDHRRQAD